jgi:hypothetical protein
MIKAQIGRLIEDLSLFELLYLRAWIKQIDPPFALAEKHRKWD